MNKEKNHHAVELGKLGREKRTKAQIEASRKNGKKGGRPRTSKKHQDDLTKRMTAANIDLMRKKEAYDKKRSS